MTRYRQNFLSGTASNVIANTNQLTITGTGFPTNIPAGQYMAITLNPGYYGTTASPEVIYINSNTTSTVASVTARAQESSVLTSGTLVPWVAGPLVADYDVTNLTSTGTLSLNNGLSVAGSSTLSTTNVNGVLTVQGAIVANGAYSTFNTGILSNGSATFNNSVAVNNTITGIPKARMYGVGTTVNSSTYTTIQTVVTGTYGFVSGGMTYSNNGLTVPYTGYYQISASIGYSAYGAYGEPAASGVYGCQLGIYTTSTGTSTGYYVAADAYIAGVPVAGLIPETVVLSDIIPLNAGNTITLIGWAPSLALAGSVAGAQTTYVSIHYIGS